MALISPENSLKSSLNKFRDSFREDYGYNVEVNFTDIIDRNKFDGFSMLKDEIDMQEYREKSILHIIKSKIDIAILNGESVYLKKDDFINIDNEKLELCNGFDLNLILLKNKDRYDFIVGPNCGSSKQGAMFQRFNKVFIKEDFDKYNDIYDFENNCNDNSSLKAELREFLSFGRLSNILNYTKNYNYYLPLGFVADKDKSNLDIKDLVIGLNNKDELYIKSKKNG